MQLLQTEMTDAGKLRMQILACMETGAIDKARTTIVELYDVDEAMSKALTMEVLDAYGIVLV